MVDLTNRPVLPRVGDVRNLASLPLFLSKENSMSQSSKGDAKTF